jgi:hypothetical protein
MVALTSTASLGQLRANACSDPSPTLQPPSESTCRVPGARACVTAARQRSRRTSSSWQLLASSDTPVSVTDAANESFSERCAATRVSTPSDCTDRSGPHQPLAVLAQGGEHRIVHAATPLQVCNGE